MFYEDYLCLYPLKHLDFRGWRVGPIFFRFIAEHTPNIRSLLLDDAIGVTSECIELLEGLPILATLSLKNTCTITASMAKVFGSFPCLSELNLSENEIEEVKVFGNIAMLCKQLRSLTCQGCAKLDDFCCQAIGQCIKRFRNLRKLDFSRCMDFTDEGLLNLLDCAIFILESLTLVKCKNLTSLSLAGLRKPMPNMRFVNVGQNLYGQTAFEFASEGCRTLTSLNVNRCPEFDDVALAMIGRRLSALLHLDMTNCFKITDDGVTAFYRDFQGSLESINITNCSHLGGLSAFAIAEKGATMKDLRMNGVSKISSEALRQLWKSCSSIVKFEMAVDLRTTTTHRRSMVPHISDDTIKQGASAALHTIKLTGAVQVTDIGASILPRKCPLLSSIDVSYCGGVTDKFIHVLCKCSKNLAHLNVSGCPYVTDRGMLLLSEGVCSGSLRKLEVGGCTKISDTGVQSIGTIKNLELLVLRSCDTVTDQGILYIAEGCPHLRSLDLSSLDLVSLDSISEIVSSCLKLTNLVCESCSITAAVFSKTVAPVMPLAMASPARCKVEARSREVVEFNKHILKQELANSSARCMQKLAKVMHKWAWIRLALRARNHAIVTIQRHARGHQHRGISNVKRAERDKHYGEVAGIQKAFRSLIGFKYARLKTKIIRSEYYSRLLLQRQYRGHMARKRTRDRFTRLWKAYHEFNLIVCRYKLVHGARKTRLCVVKIMRWYLMRRVRQYYVRLLFRTRMVQNAYRSHFARNKMKLVQLMSTLAVEKVKVDAAFKIQTFVRAKQFNAAILPFMMNCGEMFRDSLNMELWYIVRIQVNWRGHVGRKRAKLLKDQPHAIFRAATHIQSWYKPFYYTRWFAKYSFLKRLARRKWVDFLTISSRAKLYLASVVRPIQRTYRQRLFLMFREKAATRVQGAAKGFLARLYVRQKQAEMLGIQSDKIKRGYRRWKGRIFRKQLMAIEHMAAWRIQRRARANFDSSATRRIAKRGAQRRNEAILATKKALLFASRTKVVAKIAASFQFRMAHRIQRCFRSFRKEKDKRRTAEMHRLKTLKEAHSELSSHKRARALKFLPDPIKGIQHGIRAIKELMKDPNKIVADADRPRLVNGILTHQTLSLVQEGILSMHLTLGLAELDAFQQDQDFKKNARELFYKLIPGDLSGRSELKMHLWVKNGTGNECICNLEVKGKRSGVSSIARRERIADLNGKGIRLADHDQIHIELLGEMSVKMGKGGFAIDGIIICQTAEEADDAKKKGYTLVSDLMRYNLPTSIWDHKRRPYDNPDMFKMGALPKMEWMDGRLKRCVEAFNLSEEDVLVLRDSFETALGQFISEVIEVKDVLKYWNFPDKSSIAEWLVKAVNPRRKGEVTFSEYVHIVCYFCMFTKKELIRFIFGAMDVEKKCFLRKKEFRELMDILAEDTMRNPKVWMLAWPNFMNPALNAIFLPEYEAFTDENPSTLWMVQLLQKKIMEKNLGRSYWDDKVEQFMLMRKDIGVIMV